MITWQISPSPPTGKNRRIELDGIDLWLHALINHIFVYPSVLNIDQLKEALSHALARYPLIAGHLLLLNNDHYFIEMSDHYIPISFIDNTELSKWPFSSTVVIDKGQTSLEPYFSQSGELVMGISWAHVLGDAASCLRFLNTISRLYQKLEPLKPDPVFERRLWYENEADQSFLPAMKLLRDAQPREQMAISFMSDLAAYEQINLQFSGQQLAQLHKLTGEASVTIQDVLTAYFIILLNTYCFENDEQRISHTGTIINFRRVSDSISPLGYIGNSVFLMLSNHVKKHFSSPT